MDDGMNPDLTLSQIDSLASKASFSRRGFAMTSLGVGFALAAQPIQAQTVIHTDGQGLDAGEVKVRTPGAGETPLGRITVTSSGASPASSQRRSIAPAILPQPTSQIGPET